MSYISRENLSENLKGKLDKLNNIESIVESIHTEIKGTPYMKSSHEVVIQNEDYSFNPSSILISNLLGSVESPTQFKLCYSLRNYTGRWWESDNFTYIPPASIFINLEQFKDHPNEFIQYLRIDTIENNEVINSKTIPILKNGDKGDKGEGFTFEDLTEAQRELIRGHKGDTGEQGVKGEVGDVNIVHYNSQGETPYKIKIFTGETKIVADGVWTINYSHVGFTKVLGVYGNALQPSTSAGDTSTGITVTSFTNTSATGKSLKGTGVGLLAGFSNLYLTDTNASIQVLVIGY